MRARFQAEGQAAPSRVWLRATEWLLLVVFGGMLAFQTMPRAWKSLNTDFPNYLLAATLVREHADTARMYEWVWFQREKDHRGMEQPLIGLAPITPISTLMVYPLAGLRPLTAKHVWLGLQVCSLLVLLPLLRAITGQPVRRITLLAVLCYPLHRNLLYGQYYLLLSLLLAAACRATQRGHNRLAGVLIGFAAALKIFPAVFLLYFVRKRRWGALGAALLTLLAAATVSLAVFGWQLHRTYLQQVLPWTLRGEALPPYILASGSLSTLLHRLFVREADWNPHPWLASPEFFAVLQPVLQTFLLAPALLLIRPEARGARRIALEWSALMTATLAISTSPASYLFLLLILPTAVLITRLRSPTMRFVAVSLFLGIGFPGWHTGQIDGVRVLLHFPRLWCLIAFLGVMYKSLGTKALLMPRFRRETQAWAVVLLMATGLSIAAGIRHVRGMRDESAFRVAGSGRGLLMADPHGEPDHLAAIAMVATGYQLVSTEGVSTGPPLDSLAVTTAGNSGWVEQTGKSSRLIPFSRLDPVLFRPIEQAQSPVLSADEHHLAYLREERGRGLLFERSLVSSSAEPDGERRLSPADANVYSATFLEDGSLVYAASIAGGPTFLFRTGEAVPWPLGEARDPSASPDGRWLAYSRFQRGEWNLHLFDLRTRKDHAVAETDCNQLQPSWESDSRTIVYASDCDRALGLSALFRRRVVP